tara:strand:+ start:1607 stop:2062 length:456 start_codon:yes stop_codon:yes gene_type:complete
MERTKAQQEIYDSIPHRPPFLFIDEMVEVGEESASARRTVQATEPYFEGHYPGNPIMPGVLLCEAVFQTAAVYMSQRLKKEGGGMSEKVPLLSRIQEAKFKNMVTPRDVLDIEVKMKESVSRFHFMRGTIKKEGKLVLSVEFALVLADKTA